jgi:hypothetical protein
VTQSAALTDSRTCRYCETFTITPCSQRLPFKPSLGSGKIAESPRPLNDLIALRPTGQQAGLAQLDASGMAISAGATKKQQIAHGGPSDFSCMIGQTG